MRGGFCRVAASSNNLFYIFSRVLRILFSEFKYEVGAVHEDAIQKCSGMKVFRL